MKKITLFLIIAFFIQTINSQEYTKDKIIEDIVEEIATNSDNEDVDITEIQEDLEYFFDNPLNLNTATLAQLNSLHFLSDLQIKSLLEIRKKYGLFQTIYELQLIEGFDIETIQKLMPFVVVEPDKSSIDLDPKMLKYGRHQVFARWQRYIEPRKGYNIPDSVIEQNPDKSRYLGDPNKYYVKYLYKYKNKIHWGLTAEKDPGEQFFAGAQKNGFDFYSAHFQLNNIKFVKKIIIGDFQAQFGEGLAMWSGMSFGKSSMVLNIKKKPRGLRYYSSSDENFFLRGIATTIGITNNIEMSVFASSHKIDAGLESIADSIQNIDETSLDISSLLNTGYHRTPTEIKNKHTINQSVLGGNISLHSEHFKGGVNFVDYFLSNNLNTIKQPYQIFVPQDKNYWNASVNYQFEIKKMYFFGETAINPSGNIATVNSVSIPLDHRLNFVALYRYYSPKYYAFFSAPFAEGSSASNEKGLYIGTEMSPLAKFKISAYADFFTFSWLRYRLNSIYSNGAEYFVQIDFKPSRKMSMYVRYKRETKPENISSSITDEPILYTQSRVTQNFRYYFAMQINRNFNIKTRFDFSFYQKGDSIEEGFMIYQDLNYKFSKIPLTVNFRYALFDAPYNARMYAYENDVLYAFSVPGYFYKGFRTYLVVKYDLTKKITIWAKIARTEYSDRNIISQGSLDEIQANHKTEVKLQIRYKF